MIQRAAAAFVGVASGLFAYAAALGLLHSHAVAAVIALAIASLVAWAMATGRLFTFDENAGPALFKGLCGAAAVIGLILLTRLTIFIADPSRVSCSVAPSSRWEVGHSCLSAYHIAAQTVGAANVYDNALYSAPDAGTGPRTARKLGVFNVDVFEYPPQFLLLPKAFHLITTDFLDLRMLWFAFCGTVFLMGTIVIANHLGPTLGTRALMLSPLLWMSVTSTLNTLQKGNIQVAIIAAAMMAMVLFARKHVALGGALLAFTIVSKLWPGMLIVYLLTRREWRAVGWTMAFAVAFSGLTLALFGWGAFAAFLDHGPKLLSGEAFPAFRNPAAMSINLSLPNILFKLKLFGVPGGTFEVAKVLGSIYTVIAIAATVWAARRAWRPEQQPLVWLAVLIIATLRSPFLPFTYGVIPGLWLFTLLAAHWAPNGRSLAVIGLGFVALSLNWPMDWGIDPRIQAAASLIPLGLSIALTVSVLTARPRLSTTTTPEVVLHNHRPRAK